MSNLLDKSSIVLTPTAYNNGKVLCVKPSDGSGDFDFSRNSAATRVNSQGLVEDVQILSSNLVQNGSFSEQGAEEISNGSFSQQGSQLITNGDFATDSNWTKDSGWIIQNGKAVCDGVGVNSLQQSGVTAIGKTYKLTFDIISKSSDDFLVISTNFGDTYVNGSSTSIGTNTFYITPTSGTGIRFRVANGTTLTIDNVSVVEVGQNWDITQSGNDTILIENQYALFDCPDNSNIFITQSSVLTIGKTYKATFDVLSIDNGGFQFAQGGGGTISGSPTINTIGTHTFTFVAATATFGIKRALGAPNLLNGKITNISVKEVGQNWTFGTGWTIGDNKAIAGSLSNGADIRQAGIFQQSKKYKISIDANKISGTNIILRTYNGSFQTIGDLTENSSFIYTTTATNNGTLYIVSNNFNGSITNISVIEITDDTNLPRINYEGFSYQDALGSELITNGDFATDSDWTKGVGWSISGGSANGLSTSDVLQQSISSVIGKVYEITGDAVVNSGSLQVFLGGFAGNIISTGSFKIQFSPNNTNPLIFTGISFTGSIDNVSVKEYLGQEVVPDSGCGSWLFEPQSTNLITQSELFSDSSWSKTQTNVEAATITLPNGLTNGFKLFANTINISHWLEKTPFPTATIGQDYTISLFVKSAGSDFIQIAASTGFPSKFQNFNISTGAKASGNVASSSITDFGNGWYRISVTETTTGTNARYLIIPALSDITRNATFQGNANEDGVYIWGAQLEEQTYATSYIPTDGTSVTRNQDVCTGGGSAASINSSEGVLYAEIAALANDGTVRFLGLNDGSSNNRVVILYHNSNNNIRAIISSGGTKFVDVNSSVTSSLDFHKVAIKYKANDFAFWIDGVEVATDTSLNAPIGLNSLDFLLSGANNFFGKTKAVAVFPFLTDTELQELTTI